MDEPPLHHTPLRSGLGLILLLLFATLMVPSLGVPYLMLITLGGALAYRVVTKGKPVTYLRWLDDTLYLGEEIVIVTALVVMTLVVFIDVMWRTTHGADQSTLGALAAVGLLFCLGGGLTARWPNARLGQRLLAGLVAYVVLLILCVAIHSADNGFGWSQRLALVLLLWVGMLGTSMASKKHRHISIDAVRRVLPQRFLRGFQIARDGVTVIFLLALAMLATQYVRENWGDWVDSDMGAGIFASIPIPYWTASLPIAIAFGLMAARTMADIVVAPKEPNMMDAMAGADTEGNPQTS